MMKTGSQPYFLLNSKGHLRQEIKTAPARENLCTGADRFVTSETAKRCQKVIHAVLMIDDSWTRAEPVH